MSKKKKGGLAKGKPATGRQLTPAQERAAEKKALARVEQQRLAQVINLHIAGYSLGEIGNSIGATADEVDQMIQSSATRYIRNQPALRTYVRNYVSGKYTELLEPVWGKATNPKSPLFLESQDRALRILDKMAKLHGAEAPVQKEVTIEAAPETVEKMVAALAAQAGRGYDMDIFDSDDDDVVDAELVEDLKAESQAALEVSRNHVTDGEEDL